MAIRKGFALTLSNLKPHPTKRRTIGDPECRGLYVRITPRGRKTFTIVARDPGGKQVWKEIGDVSHMTLAEARQRAGEGVARIKQGQEAFPIDRPAETFDNVADNFLARYVDMQELRSAPEIRRMFDRYLRPNWGARAFTSIRRGDVTKLLDAIQDKNGAVQADRVLALLSKMFNWYASREDDYNSPIVRGMRRTKASEHARDRILNDDELRRLWSASAELGKFGAFVKLLLFTAQRRAKVLALKRSDIVDGVWHIPAEKREKGTGGKLVLPAEALELINSILPVEGNEYVFAGRGKTFMAANAKLKDALDEKTGFSDWTLHDLRRTAKSLMRRAGVSSEISERVLGHVIPGVEGVYDRHDYLEEKAEALRKLAGLIALILDPPADNVVRLERAG